MQTKFILSLILLLCGVAQGAVTSRIQTFSDGSILTAAQLNAEFNNLVDTINSLDSSNLIPAANLSPLQLNATIAGDGLSRAPSTGILSVSTDGVTIETSSNALRVKDLGISAAKLAADSVTTAKILDANVTAAKLGSNSVITAKIQDAAVTQAKHAVRTVATTATVGNIAISNSSGNFTTTSASYVDVTNLSVIANSAGSPMQLMVQASGSAPAYIGVLDPAPAAEAVYAFLRDGVIISEMFVSQYNPTSGAYGQLVPPGSLTFVDNPGAGQFTYKVQLKSVAGTTTSYLFNSKLVVYEL